MAKMSEQFEQYAREHEAAAELARRQRHPTQACFQLEQARLWREAAERWRGRVDDEC